MTKRMEGRSVGELVKGSMRYDKERSGISVSCAADKEAAVELALTKSRKETKTMARKMYFPHRVSRNERLAFRLKDDPKMRLMDLRSGKGGKGYLNHTERLAEFVFEKKSGIHVF